VSDPGAGGRGWGSQGAAHPACPEPA
jgi:hypothetical protein